MAHSFDNELANDQLSVRFFVTIDGIGAIFMDGPTFNPTASPATAWSAPTSKGQAYELKPHTLDLSDRLADIGQEILRREGKSSPGTMSITLRDDRTNYLLDLFARDKTDAKTARIFEYLGTSGLNYDTGGSGTSIWCVDGDLAGWSAPCLAYIGRETVYVPDINTGKVTLGGPVDALGDASNCTRDLFSVGSSDLRYTPNTNMPNRPRIISTHPKVWHNRIVRVFAVLCDRNGYALTQAVSSFADWTSDTNHVREVFRGTLQNNPEPDDSLTRWSLRLRSVDSLLHSSVGFESIEGSLIRVGSEYVNANEEGENYTPEGAPTVAPQSFVITESTTHLKVTINNETANKTGVLDYQMFNPGDVVKASDIFAKIEGAFTTALQAVSVTGTTPFSEISASWWDINPGYGGGFEYSDGVTGWTSYLHFKTTGSAFPSSGPDFTVTVHMADPRSILKLFSTAALPPAVDQTKSSADTGWKGVSFILTAEEKSPVTHIGPADTTIPVYLSPSGGAVASGIPSSGHAVIDREVIKYTSITDKGTTIQGLYVLNGCTRGQLGTTAARYMPSIQSGGGNWGKAEDPVSVKFVTAFSDVSIFDAILQLATSTGAGHHGSFDTLAHGVGPAMPPEHFDLGSFATARDGLGLVPWEHKINYYIDKPVKLMDLAARWLKPLGFFMHSRPSGDGSFQIGVSQANPPLESGAYAQFTAANLAADDFAVWQAGADLIVNEIKCRYKFDVAEGDLTDDSVTARDLDSISDFGVKNRTNLDLYGYQWSYTQAIQHVHQWSRAIFARYAAPYDLLTLEVDRTGWSVKVGDTILLTVPLVPNTEGSRGLNYRACTVLATKHRYHDPRGKPGSSLTVALEPMQRRSSYSPAMRGASYDAGVPAITVQANAYTTTGSTDASHFAAGDKIRVFNEGNATVTDDRTISSIAGNVITLSAALSSVSFSASTTVIVAQPYDAAEQSQQGHAHIATLTNGGADLTPFKYI